MDYTQQATFIPDANEIQMVKEGLLSIKEKGTISHEEAVAKLKQKYPRLFL